MKRTGERETGKKGGKKRTKRGENRARIRKGQTE
ncbi:hypothetical protein AMBR_MGDJBKAP_02120 [Leuconostoc pseudomesenteroides]|nr:hypothetical protein AMBR_MGDJBKAP_02120 [Leuconostoc pseudomesenteroides]